MFMERIFLLSPSLGECRRSWDTWSERRSWISWIICKCSLHCWWGLWPPPQRDSLRNVVVPVGARRWKISRPPSAANFKLGKFLFFCLGCVSIKSLLNVYHWCSPMLKLQCRMKKVKRQVFIRHEDFLMVARNLKLILGSSQLFIIFHPSYRMWSMAKSDWHRAPWKGQPVLAPFAPEPRAL